MSATEPKPSPTALRWFLFISAILSGCVLWPLLSSVAVGAVLAYVSEGPVERALRAFRLPEQHPIGRLVFSLLWALLLLVAVALPVVLALTVAIRELGVLATSFHSEQIMQYANSVLSFLQSRLRERNVELNPQEVTGRISSLLASVLSLLASRTGAALGATPRLLLELSLVAVSWLGLLLRGRSFRDEVLELVFPWPHEREILRTTTAQVIDGVLIGNVMLAAAQATVATLALVILGVPRAILWGVLSFFLSFVPILGTAAVTLGAAAWLFVSGRHGAAVAMCIFAALAGSVDNVLKPFLMRGNMKLDVFWMFFALIGGVAFFGPTGVVLGPLSFALFEAYLRSYRTLMNPPAEPPTEPAPAESTSGS